MCRAIDLLPKVSSKCVLSNRNSSSSPPLLNNMNKSILFWVYRIFIQYRKNKLRIINFLRNPHSLLLIIKITIWYYFDFNCIFLIQCYVFYQPGCSRKLSSWVFSRFHLMKSSFWSKNKLFIKSNTNYHPCFKKVARAQKSN